VASVFLLEIKINELSIIIFDSNNDKKHSSSVQLRFNTKIWLMWEPYRDKSIIRFWLILSDKTNKP
jgi:hypothetical protein